MNRGDSYWFFLEPYVFATVKRNDHALLYNTHNGDYLEYKNQPVISRLIKQLLAHKNLYVIKMTGKMLENALISRFVHEARATFMGDLLDLKHFPHKPVQMMPYLNIEKDVARFKIDAPDRVGEDLMTYVGEISIYLTNQCRLRCADCPDSFKQFPHCTRKDGSPAKHLPLSTIERLFRELAGTSLFRVSFLGGDVLLYPFLEDLIEILQKFRAFKSFYIYFENILNSSGKFETLRRLEGDTELIVLLDFPLDASRFADLVELVTDLGLETTFCYRVKNESEAEMAEEIHRKSPNVLYQLQPYFDGTNLDFFERNVFLSKDIILGARPTFRDIFSRQAFNGNNFGKLTMFPGGGVYSNVNLPKLGNINRHSLYEIVYQELLRGRSWRMSRSRVKPCNGCVFEALCPPLSNYELVMGRNNLCDVLSSRGGKPREK